MSKNIATRKKKERKRKEKIPVKGQSRSLKVVPFGRLGTVSH